MKRITVEQRPNYQQIVENQGFSFHTANGVPYWDETACYSFSSSEIDKLESITNELYGMCLRAVDYVISNNLFEELSIPKYIIPKVIESWNNRDTSIYGRFDLCLTNSSEIKMLEFNADTPTSLLESSIIQWFWLEDANKKYNKDFDQFNSIHEKLQRAFSNFNSFEKYYFSGVGSSVEDYETIKYIEQVAKEQGLNTSYIDVSNIGYNNLYFTDLFENKIENIFKLYPWEFMLNEPFGAHLSSTDTKFIEPYWKMILSNKAILAVLWKLYPNHKNLVPAYFEKNNLTNYAKKPFFSREGANIELNYSGMQLTSKDEGYGDKKYVYQDYIDIKTFEGFTPILGSWVVDGESAGIGIREDFSKITSNGSRFMPHFFS